MEIPEHFFVEGIRLARIVKNSIKEEEVREATEAMRSLTEDVYQHYLEAAIADGGSVRVDRQDLCRMFKTACHQGKNPYASKPA